MKTFSLAILVFFTFFSLPLQAQNKNAEGKLFIIGGGHRSDDLMKQLVTTADFGPNDYIIVLPMASAEPDTGFLYVSRQLARHTKAAIRNFNFNQHDANDPQWTDSVAGARLIYILGGDQNRFMKSVLNTPVYAAIHAAYKRGATIAGTSAGAAVMSRYMITGRQLRDTVYKETFDKLWDSNIEFDEGLGLLQRTIIDQHFVRRSRYNRLLSALAAKPDYTCVGIDEGTALVVQGKKAWVAGDSQVLRFQLSKKGRQGNQDPLMLEGVQLDVYTEGHQLRIQP